MQEGKSKPRGIDVAHNVFAYIGFGIIALITILITVDVLARQITGTPVIWIPEVSEYGLLWVGFLAAAWTLREGGHVSIDLVLQKVGSRTSHTMNFVTSVIGVLICAVVTWFGAVVVVDFWRRGVPSMEMLSLPRALIFAAIPVGAAFLTIEFVRRARSHWTALRGRT